jgi:protoheme IX farnesyltransferase
MKQDHFSLLHPHDPSSAQTSQVRDFVALLKPKVMSLVVFTGFAGMWIAPNFDQQNPILIAIALFALALGAGAAGAFNMWYDRDIDAMMKRTENRPIPKGRVLPDDGLFFSIFMSILSVMLMGLSTNWLAAGILAFANLFYGVIYTMILKRRTPQNIVIGGAAGAFPPMIGWAAMTGSISILPILLFLIIFLWTPPHFWALSLFACEDYQKAGIPMLNVTHGAPHTKKQMLIYTLILFPITIAPAFFPESSSLYGCVAAILSGFFIYCAYKVLKTEDLAAAKRMFGYSVFYLFALFLALMLL